MLQSAILMMEKGIGYRHRRIGSPASSMDGYRGLQAFLRHGIAMGCRRLRKLPRYCGRDSQQCSIIKKCLQSVIPTFLLNAIGTAVRSNPSVQT